MTSAISYESIDQNYPVAGQDNNSQGFRDNFSYIKNGLATAASELTDLQTKVVLTEQLGEGGGAADNDFNGSLIRNVEMVQTYGTVRAATDDNSITLVEAEYHLLSFNNSTTITLSGWPGDGSLWTKMRLELKNVSSSSITLDFAGPGGSVIKSDTTIPLTLAVSDNSKFLEVWSADNGSTIFIKDLGEFETV
jgi:hypothetical protein